MEFNLSVAGRRRVAILRTGASSSRRRWAHFPRDYRQDRFVWWPEAAGGKVAVSGRCLGPCGGLHPRAEERPPWHGPLSLTGESTCVDCLQCSQTAGGAAGGITCVSTQGPWLIGRHPIRPVLKHGPRSLTCARVTGRQTQGRNESEVRPRSDQVGSPSKRRGRTTGPS